MKSLYSILGVPPDAPSQQIETAYAEALEQCQSGKFSADHADAHIRLVAIKEAYTTLSDPLARKRYNQRLFANDATDSAQGLSFTVSEQEGFWSFKKVFLLALVLVIGGAYYLHNVTERERMRIQHERDIANKALQLLEEQEKRKAGEVEARQARLQQLDTRAQARQTSADDERFRQHADQQARQAMYAQQREAQEKERQQKQSLYEAQRQVARDKTTLQRLERENYGKVLTY